jgi:Domain of unknown function (DUF3846)
MAILVTADGHASRYPPPQNGSDYSLEELREAIGGGYIQVLAVPPDKLMVIDEDGKAKGLPYNHTATYIVAPQLMPGDWIAGDALMIEATEMR